MREPLRELRLHDIGVGLIVLGVILAVLSWDEYVYNIITFSDYLPLLLRCLIPAFIGCFILIVDSIIASRKRTKKRKEMYEAIMREFDELKAVQERRKNFTQVTKRKRERSIRANTRR